MTPPAWDGPALPVADLRRCAADPEFAESVGTFYAELDGWIAEYQPVCHGCGDCCGLAKFGHHLFVTTVELAYFLAVAAEAEQQVVEGGGCPYQREGRCTVRQARPSGCRIYFCEPPGQDDRDWQSALTEEALQRLRAIGQRFQLPYAYVDWTKGLCELAEGTDDQADANPPV